MSNKTDNTAKNNVEDTTTSNLNFQKSDSTTSSESTNNKDAATGAYLVCDGATCQCSAGAVPFINLPITSQTKAFAQNKLIATIFDTKFSLRPFETCNLNPDKLGGQPCLYSTPGIWDIKADPVHPMIGGKLLLTDNAEMKCPRFPNGTLSIFMHGQTVGTTETSTEKVDDIAYTINPLMESVEEKKKTRNISVNFITCNGKKSQKFTNKKKTLPKVEKLSVRANEILTIKAVPGKKDKTPELISWCIWNRKINEDETAPMTTESGQVYEHYGAEIELSIKKGQSLFIEAFGASVAEREAKNKTYTDCMFLIEAVENDITEIYEIKKFEKSGNSFTAKAGTAISFEVNSVFGNFTQEELEFLDVVLKDEGGSLIERCNKQDKINISESKIANEGTYSIEISYKETKKKYILEVYDNYITSITPNLTQVRMGDDQEFILGLKHPAEKLDMEKITWEILDKRNSAVKSGTGDTINYHFPNGGKYTITAIYKNKFNFLSLKDKVVGKYTLEAIRNSPAFISMPVSTLYLGAPPIKIDMITVLSSYWKGLDGAVEWEISFTRDEKIEPSKEKANIVLCESNYERAKSDTGTTIKENTAKLSGGDILLFTPMSVGKFEIKATLNGKSCETKTIEVKNGEIVLWSFMNNIGQRLTHIGWNQNFKVCIHVKGWNNQKLDVYLFYRIKSNKALIGEYNLFRLFVKEYYRESFYKGTINLNNDGLGEWNIGDEKFWKKIEKSKYKKIFGLNLELGKNAEFYLAVKKTSDLYVYDSLEPLIVNKGNNVLLNNLIVPLKNIGSTRYHLNMDEEKTIYEAMFLEEDRSKLTRVVQYGENVGIAFQVYCGKDFDPHQYEYMFRMFENLEGKDKEVEFNDKSKHFIKFDKSYKSVGLNLNTGQLKGKDTHVKDKGTAYNPRCYYLTLYQRKNKKDKWGNPILFYPSGYNDTGWSILTSGEKKNDQYMLNLSPEIEDPKHAAVYAAAEAGLSSISDKDTKSQIEKSKQYLIDEDNKEKINKLDDKKRQNYFLQLKVAKETTLNTSLGRLSPIIIGEPLSCTKQKDGECVCKKYNFAWSGKISCEERKKVLEVCAELWGESNKVEKANQLMSVMRIESNFKPAANETTLKGLYFRVIEHHKD